MCNFSANMSSRHIVSKFVLHQPKLIFIVYLKSYFYLELVTFIQGHDNLYIQQVKMLLLFCQEIEEKAPILKKQREDYENSLESISQLTAQLDAALTVGHFENC